LGVKGGLEDFSAGGNAVIGSGVLIRYELLGLVIERSSNIVSLFKELENIRIDA
jgi:hypothetical protein